MPGSAVVHAAVFTAGALLGGGIAAVVTSRKNQQQPVLPTRPVHSPPVPIPVPEQQTQISPVIGVGTSGKPKFAENEQILVSPVLKYGNPG